MINQFNDFFFPDLREFSIQEAKTIVFRPKRECEYDKRIGSLQLRYSRPICNLCQVHVLLPLFLQPACNVQGAEIQKNYVKSKFY